MQLERSLTWRLHRLHKLTDLESQRAYLEQTGLSLGDGRCLAAIGAFAPLSVNDLADAAHLTKGQASRAAQWLVEQGLVRKAADATDARGVLLTLTAKGRRLWAQTMEVIARRNEEIFGQLSDAEREQFGHTLDRLLEGLTASTGVADG
jgi:DNA-binding MarR family transcriptional regulator